MKYYSKNKLNSIYRKMIHVILGRKGFGKSYYEELKSKKIKLNQELKEV